MDLKFTVEWEPRWSSFLSSAAVVVQRGQRGLPRDYVRTGIRLRTPALTVSAHLALLVLGVLFGGAVWSRLDRRTPALRNPLDDYQVYYVPQDLPNVSDQGGAQNGLSGAHGGAHAFHARQLIRVARGQAPVKTVADAPKLKLPVTKEAAANLMMLLRGAPQQFLPASPDTRGLHASTPSLITPAVAAPAPPLDALRSVQPATLPVQVVEPAPKIVAMKQPTPSLAEDVVVPPPPSLNLVHRGQLELPPASVVPPSPAVAGLHDKTTPVPLMAAVSPPPRVTEQHGGIAALGGNPAAAGRNGPGNSDHGGGNDGSPAGSSGSTAIVISSAAGSSVGIPEGSGAGVAVMSPRGGSKAGAGGTNGSTGSGNGAGSGTGNSGAGSGGGTAGPGYAADPNAHGGLFSSTGPGGAGRGTSPRAAPGVVIAGGVVDIPSFGATPEPGTPQRMPQDKTHAPAVLIVATSRSGGALGEYGALGGGRVYTTYVDTARGTVVLQFADPASRTSDDFGLTPPRPIQVGMPGSGKLMRTVVSCILDRTGSVKNVRVLESATPQVASAILQFLNGWRFRPALRGEHAVEVRAILGFGITTE